MSARPYSSGLVAAVVLGLAACTHTPVVDRTAALITNSPLTPTLSAAANNQRYEDVTWWRAMGGEPLHQLVLKGLQSNTDIGIALTRVKEARAGVHARDSALWPSLDLNGAYQNTRSGLPPQVKQGRPDTRVWQASLNLDWELDLFGRNQAQADAAEQDVLSSEAGVAGARLMLITEIARQFVLHQGAVRKLASLDEIIALQETSQSNLEHQAQEGEASVVQVDGGRARLQEMRAQRPALLTIQAVTQAHLAKLTSSTPNEVAGLLANATASNMTWAAPEPMPTGQPVDLLERRPDIMAARSAWRAEFARLDSAKTDLLPRFFLSLVTGRQDLTLNGLHLAPVGFHETAVAFALPLFNAGRVQASIDIQDAAAQRAELRYEQAIRQAAEDVESALAQFHQSRDRASALDLAKHARQKAAAHGKRLFEDGQISRMDRLALEQAHASAALNGVDAQESARLALIQLHQALGGGWQSAPEHAFDSAQQEARP